MRIESIERDEVERVLRIHTEDGEDFELSLQAEEARGLTPGLVLDPPQVDAVRKAADRKAIAKKVFAWLDRRRRTRSWLRRRLLDADHIADAVETVLEDFARQGLVDDREYARAWCADQVRRKPVGRLWLHARLRREGVDDECAWSGIDAVLPDELEREFAARALERKSLDLGDVKQRAKAMRFLQSRGFGPSLCRATIDEQRRRQGKSGGGDALESDVI